MRRAADLDTAVQKAGGAGAQRPAPLMALGSLWARSGKQREMISMRSATDSGDVRTAESRSEQASPLSEHLGQVLAGRPVGEEETTRPPARRGVRFDLVSAPEARRGSARHVKVARHRTRPRRRAVLGMVGRRRIG